MNPDSRCPAILEIIVALVTTVLPPAVAFAADCNQNAIEDACDIACGPAGGACDVAGCGASSDCNGNGVPDESDLLFQMWMWGIDP